MNEKLDYQDAQLILASKSPRRAHLLSEAGFTFSQMTPPFDDPAHPEIEDHESAMELATFLAMEKAKSLAPEVKDKTLIIAADTICVDHDSNLIGTPVTEPQAREMIQTFSSAIHYVITGVAVLALDEQQYDEQNKPVRKMALSCFADEAIVMLGHLEEQQIDNYLALNTWQGKAGGYNLTERQEAGWPIIVNGEDTTVVGLPIPQTIKALEQFNVFPQTN